MINQDSLIRPKEVIDAMQKRSYFLKPNWKWSKTSKRRLETCDQRLQDLINLALTKSPLDMGVASGHRTEAEQFKLVEDGLSETMDSKHRSNPSLAVDVFAFVNNEASWTEEDLLVVAEAVKESAIELDLPVRWGGAWRIYDIRNDLTMSEMHQFHIDSKLNAGEEITAIDRDFYHFEIGK